MVELARWNVSAGGRTLGQIARLQIQDPAGPIVFYRITDRAGRHVGDASEAGRFSRRRPDFLGGDEDLGVWSLERGLALLFDASAPVALVPVPVDGDFRKDR